MTHRLTTALATVLALTLIAAIGANGTVKVTADGDGTWLFNRDASTSTPYEFSLDEASTGYGSLYVPPITNTTASGAPEPKDKFIAEQFLGTGTGDRVAVADLDRISYDFQIAGAGDASDANEFYLNLYTLLADVDGYYDCRYDYVPTTGSTSAFTTASFRTSDTPARVTSRGGASCPATPSALPSGAVVNFFALSVGDTSANDTGLAGYYDNVVVSFGDGSWTAYDFEPTPATKDDCKKGGWERYGYRNQGQCVSSVARRK